MADWKRNLSLRILDRLVLCPTRHTIDANELIRFEIEHPTFTDVPSAMTEAYLFTNAQEQVEGTNRIKPTLETIGVPPRHLVLKFAGTGGRAERSSEAPLNWIEPHVAGPSVPQGEHFEVWTWNPPGYGRSSPPARLAHQVTFAEDFAAQIARHRCGPDTTVWLVGNSLGCIKVLWLASRVQHWRTDSLDTRRIGLWCRNPPDLGRVILRIARRYYASRWMRRIVNHLPETMDTLSSAAACRLPAVFLTSELDSLVPAEYQADLHQAYAGPKQVVLLEGLEHDGLLEDQHIAPVQSAAQWLLKQTTSGRDD
ncbi:alpha/beta hydrolase [Neorhodopirellula pilleata]|uniref:Alpha/beta hydrolase family protein n=1 Tax=Neorhodopirellula pilleata TaxID=2714738 RepID=A0A5C6AWC5_9BACT|nr:alpha/beta fold hydrolase [Neorhodopirellula pilleata]TWU03376.1 Alpha/beta hydrolase family protein [Neorhodopirellula pilleata]